MGPISGDDDIFVAQSFDRVNYQFFVGIHGQKALATEVIAGRMLQPIAPLVAEFFPTLVETIQPGRSPATETLEKGCAQRRKSFKDTPGKHGAEGEH